MPITLVSTAVVPAFAHGQLTVVPVELNADMLSQVGRNLHGHAATVACLRDLAPDLPQAERGFWDGTGLALAVRPRGGVRGAGQAGDTPVGLADLEAVMISWRPVVGQVIA